MAFPFSDIQAISFDLDDTLYENHRVIAKAEQWLTDELVCRYGCPLPDWDKLLAETKDACPEIASDISALRLYIIQNLLQQQGLALDIAQMHAHTLFDAFLKVRSKVQVTDQTHAVLKQLKTRFKIAAITNGNVLLDHTGLAHYFDVVVFAGNGLGMKPDFEIFHACAAQLKLPPEAIVHVGDHLIADVQGARQAGFGAIWFNPNQQDVSDMQAHAVIEDLEQLLKLL